MQYIFLNWKANMHLEAGRWNDDALQTVPSLLWDRPPPPCHQFWMTLLSNRKKGSSSKVGSSFCHLGSSCTHPILPCLCQWWQCVRCLCKENLFSAEFGKFSRFFFYLFSLAYQRSIEKEGWQFTALTFYVPFCHHCESWCWDLFQAIGGGCGRHCWHNWLSHLLREKIQQESNSWFVSLKLQLSSSLVSLLSSSLLSLSLLNQTLLTQLAESPFEKIQ